MLEQMKRLMKKYKEYSLFKEVEFLIADNMLP